MRFDWFARVRSLLPDWLVGTDYGQHIDHEYAVEICPSDHPLPEYAVDAIDRGGTIAAMYEPNDQIVFHSIRPQLEKTAEYDEWEQIDRFVVYHTASELHELTHWADRSEFDAGHWQDWRTVIVNDVIDHIDDDYVLRYEPDNES
jgi:hypothetical protein